MRPDRLYLADILGAANAIADFLERVEEERFTADGLLQSAVLQKLMVIGEAASRVSSELRERHPQVEWRTIVGLRNVVAHQYFAIEWSLIWTTAIQDVPALREQISAIIEGDEKG